MITGNLCCFGLEGWKMAYRDEGARGGSIRGQTVVDACACRLCCRWNSLAITTVMYPVDLEIGRTMLDVSPNRMEEGGGYESSSN